MSAPVAQAIAEGGAVFEQARGAPCRSLAGDVLAYTGYSHRDGPGGYRRREPAQEKVTLILNFGPSMEVAGPGFDEPRAGSFVAPLSDTYAVTTEGSRLEGLQVDLTPLGARRVFGLPMTELGELIVPLEAALGQDAGRLVDRLREAPGWAERFGMLDAFFSRRLAVADPASPDVAWAWDRLGACGGRLRVAELAAELGCSRRHLNARFRDQVGLGPKAVARVMRFRRAAGLLVRDDGSRFAEIAQACGYCDQAHLNRDFGELAGTSPGDYLAKSLPDGFGVAA